MLKRRLGTQIGLAASIFATWLDKFQSYRREVLFIEWFTVAPMLAGSSATEACANMRSYVDAFPSAVPAKLT